MTGTVLTRYFGIFILAWFVFCGIAVPIPGMSPDYQWLNQTEGPRPQYVWENREDVIYHDLSYGDKTIETAPEIVPFMHRAWVFNKAMQWRREPEGILCYSAPATLLLTGEKSVSAWHSDPANELSTQGEYTIFHKLSINRRRDCAVLPAFQFHIGQNPTVELEVAQATGDWQFVVSVKGRSGPPLLASDWKRGRGKVIFDLASILKVKGYDLNYAELHFIIGTWTDKPEDEASIRFRLHMTGRPALVACLPVVRTAEQARESGVPILAVALDEKGRRLGKDKVRVRASIEGRTIGFNESDGIWRASVWDLEPGDYTALLQADGNLHDKAELHLRVTDGQFWQYDKEHHLFSRGGKIAGPLSGSYQGNFFVREAGGPYESLVHGQDAWNQWDRSKPPGEHLHYWEALTADEMDERFAYLKSCGWDILHVCQHWGIWERLDAGGHIAPHGAEQIALYLRTAGHHGLAVIQALTHYEYSTRVNGWHGTVPFTSYLEAGFESEDFLRPGRNPKFDDMFHRYLRDYVTLFGAETALFAMTASGEGDATIGYARAHDIFDFVRSLDSAHMFLGEPTHILSLVPRRYTNGWRQDLFGGRTYAIAQNFMPEYDLGVEMKLYQLGGLAMAEGSWGASNLYAAFHHHTLSDGGWPDESWIGSKRYRIRLRDSLYLGLVHRLPKMMTWDEQIAEDEHRLVRTIRQQVDWTQPFKSPPIAVRLAGEEIGADHRRVLVQYEEALSRMALSYKLIHHDDPVPQGIDVVLDAAKPFSEPAFVSDDGTIPDVLKESIPITATPGYALNYCWSKDRDTLLAYVYNVTDHFEKSLPLAGRFHRNPKPAELALRLQHLPDHDLRLRIYNLNSKSLVYEASLSNVRTIELEQTAADYFVLVTPIVQAKAQAKLSESDSTLTTSQPGVCVHLGATDGQLEIRLAADGRSLVHALALDDRSLIKARVAIQARGLYPLASVEEAKTLERLPYADNLVALLIADLDALGEEAPSREEILRILHPEGVACLKKDGKWNRIVKPRPDGMDDWTHLDYDASGNAVSHDKFVKPPTQIQWISGLQPIKLGGNPAGFVGSPGMRLADGRAISEWVVENNDPRLTKNYLGAWNAFSGIPLWAIEKRYWGTRRPMHLVAVADRIYTFLEEDGPVVSLDAATGKLIRSYDKAGTLPSNNGFASFRVFDDRILIAIEGTLSLLSQDTGDVLWQFSDPQEKLLLFPTVYPVIERVFAVASNIEENYKIEHRWPNAPATAIICLDLNNGRPLWKNTQVAGKHIGQLIYNDGFLGLFGPGGIGAGQNPFTGCIRTSDNKLIWTGTFPTTWNRAGYVMLWRDGRMYYADPWKIFSLDPRTGRESHIYGDSYNGRCTRFCATDDYFICSLVTYVDRSFNGTIQSITRSACANSAFPANGMLYFTPTACGCTTMLRGHSALTPDPLLSPLDDSARLEIPAGSIPARRVPRRFALNDSPIAQSWTRQARAPFTQTESVAFKNAEFLALTHEHLMQRRDVEANVIWSFTAGGRISSPPIVHENLCIFGCHDGYVYALRVDDGSLAWRFLAAPYQRKIVTHAQLESAWPVYGVTIHKGLLCASAGLHPELGGGIYVYGLEPETGKLIWKRTLAKSPAVIAGTERINSRIVPNSVLNDVLQSNGDLISLPVGRNNRFTFDPRMTDGKLRQKLETNPPKEKH